MNRLTIAAALATALVACSDDADIGIDQQPVTCSPDQQSKGTLKGALTNPYNDQGQIGPGGKTFQLGEVTELRLNVHAQTGDPVALTMRDENVSLAFFFSCGAPTRDTYDVYPSDQSTEVPCPLSVTSSAGGLIEYLAAEDGTFIVDENESCLAARFSVDFGDYGAASGSFSVPK